MIQDSLEISLIIGTLELGHSLAPLTCLLAPLTHSLSPHYSLRSRATAFVRSLVPELVGLLNIFVQFSMCLESQWNDYEIDA